MREHRKLDYGPWTIGGGKRADYKSLASLATNKIELRNSDSQHVSSHKPIPIVHSPIKTGDRRDSNPQQPGPQPGALPLSYGHHEI